MQSSARGGLCLPKSRVTIALATTTFKMEASDVPMGRKVAVELVPCTLVRANLHCELPLRRPIFDFSTHGPPFFAMIRDALTGKYIVNASDFSFRPSNNLGEVQFRYNLFGGQASVALTVEKLIFDFPTCR